MRLDKSHRRRDGSEQEWRSGLRRSRRRSVPAVDGSGIELADALDERTRVDDSLG